MNKTSNPVHQDNGNWYFYDEVWCQRLGPFSSKELAAKACFRYAAMYLDGQLDPYPEIAEIINKENIKWGVI